MTAVTASAMVVTATQAPGRSRPAVEMTAHPEMMTTLSLCQEAPQGRMAVRTSVRQCCGQAVPQSPETASVTVVTASAMAATATKTPTLQTTSVTTVGTTRPLQTVSVTVAMETSLQSRHHCLRRPSSEQAPGRSRPAVEMTAHPETMTTLSLPQGVPRGRMAVRTSVRQCCGQAVPPVVVLDCQWMK